MSGGNYRLVLQYDGTAYAGWQVQPRRPTIQGTLEQVLEKLCGEPVSVIGAGRTDAGVHARGQVANFHSSRSMEPESWRRALNALLPPDIRVVRVSRAGRGFHARFDARSRTYRYHVYTGPVLPPWENRYVWHRPLGLALSEMNRAALQLLGRHDLRSFAAAGSEARSFERRITHSAFHRRGQHLVYTIEADAFLQHTVRIVVGTLLEVGLGRRPANSFRALLKARDRQLAGRTAPARGLFLERVRYRRAGTPGAAS